MSSPDPSYSAGARYERKALRTHLEKKLKACDGRDVPQREVYELELKWVRTRQARYDKKPGGL